jgi:hypothetical protein
MIKTYQLDEIIINKFKGYDYNLSSMGTDTTTEYNRDTDMPIPIIIWENDII